MDFKKVFIGFMLVFVCAFAVYGWVSFLNEKYVPLGATRIDTGFYSEVSYISETGESLAVRAGNATNPSGVSTSASEGILSQSRSTFSIVRDMIGFIPNLYFKVGAYLGVPATYAKIGGIIFIFSFAITIAYLFLLGNTTGE